MPAPQAGRGLPAIPAGTDRRFAARFVTAFLVLGIGLPVTVAAGAAAPTLQYLLVWVVAVHAAAGLSAVLASPTVRPLHLGFWAYTYCFFGLAGIAQIGSGSYPTGLVYPTGITQLSVVIVEVGQLAFTVGSLTGARTRRPAGRSTAHTTPPAFERVWSQRRLLQLGALLLAAAAFVLWRVLPRYGSVRVLFTSRQATHQTIAAASGADSTISLITWGVSVPALWLLLGLLRAGGDAADVGGRTARWFGPLRRRPFAAWVLLLGVVVLNVAVNNPISRPRFWAGTVLLALVFTAPRLRRAGTFRAAAAGFLVLLIVVFPYADYFRYTATGQLQTTSVGTQFEQKLDYDSLSQVQVGIDYVQRTGYHPVSASAAPLFWVPRSLWPDKPPDTGILLSEWVGYRLTNRSAPLWIESYLWAGLPAVVVVFLLLGLLWRRLDDAFDRARRRRPDAIILTTVPTLAFFEIIVLRGSLLQAAAPLLLMVLAPWALSRRVPAAPVATPPEPVDSGDAVGTAVGRA